MLPILNQQDLLDQFVNARISVIYETSGECEDDIRELNNIVTKYANDNNLCIPQRLVETIERVKSYSGF